jgi:hypothetical protein
MCRTFSNTHILRRDPSHVKTSVGNISATEDCPALDTMVARSLADLA